ncbi:hypothetical protein C1646_661249 [Rhizophagus diaphanus]|nr:hypothetical protein C1646_661249 [Rhizophagus diaphanus] [Rhizophagus sp. MUCL 43196]
MEFDSNDIQDDDVNEMSEQNPSEKEKGYNLKGEQTRICNILDKNGKRCGKDRLFYLKDAIIQLQADLYISTNREDKKDEVTRYFSGNTYVTLSKMMVTIKELIFNLATSSVDSPADDNDYNNENTIFEENEIENEIEIDNEEIISNITKKRITIKDPLNTEGVLHKILIYVKSGCIQINPKLRINLLIFRSGLPSELPEQIWD